MTERQDTRRRDVGDVDPDILPFNFRCCADIVGDAFVVTFFFFRPVETARAGSSGG